MKITICGSMSAKEAMETASVTLRELGYEVETPDITEGRVLVELDADRLKKQGFIDQHFAKIDRSDAILVTNLAKNGIANYIGGNTLIEMGHAYASGLEIFLYNPIPDTNFRDEAAAMHPIVLDGDLEKIPEYFASLPRVHISSESPVKHLAVSRAFRRAGIPVQTVAEPTPSGVNEQPASIDETYEGAINRHNQLLQRVGKVAKDDYFVTIESGIFTPRSEHNYFGCAALVVEKSGERHIGLDVDVEFPRHMTDRVPSEFKDLGELVQKQYGSLVKDPYPYFTNQKLTRAKILENALYNVIVQLQNE